MLSPLAAAFIRNLLARYALQLESALYLSSEGNADDWRTILRNVYQAPPDGPYTVRFRILKYNGDVAAVESSPDGILAFVRTMLSALNDIGDSKAFEGDTSSFIEEAERLIEILRPTPSESGPSTTEPAQLDSAPSELSEPPVAETSLSAEE